MRLFIINTLYKTHYYEEIFFWLLILLLFTQCNLKQKRIEEAAEAINKITPRQVGEITRLDSCTTLPSTLIYHYTLSLGDKYTLTSIPLFTLFQEKQLNENLKSENVTGNVDMRKFAKDNIDLVFNYYVEGELISSILVNNNKLKYFDLSIDSSVYKQIERVTELLLPDFPQELETGTLLDIKTVFPRTLEMNVRDDQYIASVEFDSISFKKERMDDYFEVSKNNLYSDYLGSNVLENITYRYIFQDKDGNYLTTIESTIKDYDNMKGADSKGPSL